MRLKTGQEDKSKVEKHRERVDIRQDRKTGERAREDGPGKVK